MLGKVTKDESQRKTWSGHFWILIAIEYLAHNTTPSDMCVGKISFPTSLDSDGGMIVGIKIQTKPC